ncbi:MAG: tRNA1(Val) (adenine(37)-N6)-methyltransferase, partial [Gemmatimonadales bacterium]
EEGYRSGIEPVLLAAAIPARPGDRVLEAGAGAGAGLMCLAARVPGITGVGVELDPAMAEVARTNIAANALPGLEILTGDIRTLSLGTFDHAFANPPWHDARSTPSPVDRRRAAKQAASGELEAWTEALRRALRPDGTLTLILPAQTAARLGAPTMQLLPKAGRRAKLSLVRVAGNLAAEPVVLHQESGAYTPEIEVVLRDGAALL